MCIDEVADALNFLLYVKIEFYAFHHGAEEIAEKMGGHFGIVHYKFYEFQFLFLGHHVFAHFHVVHETNWVFIDRNHFSAIPCHTFNLFLG